MGEGFTRTPSEVTVWLRAPGVATDQDFAVYKDVGASSAESRDGVTVKLEKMKLQGPSLAWAFFGPLFKFIHMILHFKKKKFTDTSLVVQWLRICLPTQGTCVQLLVGETKIPHASGQLSPCATN